MGKLLRYFARSVTGQAAREEKLQAEQSEQHPEYHVSNARAAFVAQLMPRLSQEVIDRFNQKDDLEPQEDNIINKEANN